MTTSVVIMPSLLINCRWGVEAKREASPSMRWRDAPDASLMRVVLVRSTHFNGRQPSGLNINNLDCRISLL